MMVPQNPYSLKVTWWGNKICAIKKLISEPQSWNKAFLHIVGLRLVILQIRLKNSRYILQFRLDYFLKICSPYM